MSDNSLELQLDMTDKIFVSIFLQIKFLFQLNFVLGSAWFLDRVSIEDPIRQMTFEIPCNAWLATTSNDQRTMRDLQVASMISHRKGEY